jgi:predicted MFS family arabinose efflux permease
VTVSAAMLVLVHTVVQAPSEGWGSLATVGGFIGAAALLALFVTIERRSRQPLVRLGILRSGPLVRANVLAMTLFGAYLGFQFIGTLYMQSLLGWSPITTALAFLPAGVIVALGSTRVAQLVNRFGTQRLIAVAFGLFAIGFALFLRIDQTPVYAAVILPTMVLIGVAFALGFPSLNIQATAGVADHEQGLAGGLLNTSFQLGGAIGLAVVTAVVTGTTGKATDPSAVLAGFRPGVAVSTGIAALGFVVALSGVLAPIWARRTVEVAEG